MLEDLRVVEVGTSLAVTASGRFLAELGADVRILKPARSLPFANLRRALQRGKRVDESAAHLQSLTDADVILSGGAPLAARRVGTHPVQLRKLNARAVITHISPYGLTGRDSEMPATDLTLFAASGLARLLIGQVEDPELCPPQRAIGEQSAFIGGLAAACASVASAFKRQPTVVDVSMHEALATMAITELSRAGLGLGERSRLRHLDGNGATVCILPAADGFVAVSPREERQWQAWLAVMGKPAWGADARFKAKADRIVNWDSLYELMSAWSCQHPRMDIVYGAQQARVPAFELRNLSEHLGSPQLCGRQFFEAHELELDDAQSRVVQLPTLPVVRTKVVASDLAHQPPGDAREERLSIAATQSSPGVDQKAQSGALTPDLPLAGIRVLDFSWVIAGPTATRYLSALGATVIKVEAPGSGDPGRASELHTVLGQGKQAITLDLKNPAGLKLARELAAASDILVENYATGVMDRLGMGVAAVHAIAPHLVYLSASGMGRTGPQAHAVAYGTLLQCYSGFAELNGVPGQPPRVGMAWLDPMCGLMLATLASAGLGTKERTRPLRGVHIDFSMIEAMLWTLTGPLIDAQTAVPEAATADAAGSSVPNPGSSLGATLPGNLSTAHAPHDIYRVKGDDAWVAVAIRHNREWIRLCERIVLLRPFRDAETRARRTEEVDAALKLWCARHRAEEVVSVMREVGIACAEVVGAQTLVSSQHLHSRGFWQQHGDGYLPGLPWRTETIHKPDPAPAQGADKYAVLEAMLALDCAAVDALESAGAFG